MQAGQAAQLERFKTRLYQTFEKGRREHKLAGVGNFAIVIHKTAAWTVFTSGPRLGVHEELSDELLDFVLAAKLDVFLEMYGGENHQPLDVPRAIRERRLAMQGDLNVFLRFLRINEAADLLSIRGAQAAPKLAG
jgi:hypothetical protein